MLKLVFKKYWISWTHLGCYQHSIVCTTDMLHIVQPSTHKGIVSLQGIISFTSVPVCVSALGVNEVVKNVWVRNTCFHILRILACHFGWNKELRFGLVYLATWSSWPLDMAVASRSTTRVTSYEASQLGYMAPSWYLSFASEYSLIHHVAILITLLWTTLELERCLLAMVDLTKMEKELASNQQICHWSLWWAFTNVEQLRL